MTEKLAISRSLDVHDASELYCSDSEIARLTQEEAEVYLQALL